MRYEDWERLAPDGMRRDPLWGLRVYRAALFMGQLGRQDSKRLLKSVLTREIASQLAKSTGSIAANIAEGYSRASGRERARFYEYALGSARESQAWYLQVREDLGDSIALPRIGVLTTIVRILTSLITRTRPS
jgi:four helix bundle protein